MIARARAKGLDVEHEDGVEFLGRLPDGSQGVVFAAQIVEHLPSTVSSCSCGSPVARYSRTVC